MEDIIIIVILIVIFGIAIGSIIKRSRSKSSCCSSGTYVAKSKKLSHVYAKKTFKVEGMSCQHCVNRVMEDVQDLGGTSAVVNLKKATVTISMEQEISDETLIAAIEKGGYKVIGKE